MASTLYGQETLRAVENFHITGQSVSLHLMKAVAVVKHAAALANLRDGRLSQAVADAIVTACEEIRAGRWDDQFITDAIQGGAGTSLNMNVNEVIATRASQLLADVVVHPLDHVNLAQSTNDVVPTALRLTMLQLLDEYLLALDTLQQAFDTLAAANRNIAKVGRTHLQDAVPVTFGQEFGAYATYIARDIARLRSLHQSLSVTNLGGTAIGTQVNGSANFTKIVNDTLADLTGYPFHPADDLIDATQNVDPLIHAAYLLQLSTLGLSKISNDLRLMASGPRAGLCEITLPALQKGSTIMAGKVNPVQLEALNQVSFQVSGNAQVGSMVLLSGQFELNVMLPVFAKTIIESFTILTGAVRGVVPTIAGIQVRTQHVQSVLEHSTATATAFNRILGYDKTAEIVRRALQSGNSFKQEIIAEGVMSEDEVERVMRGE